MANYRSRDDVETLEQIYKRYLQSGAKRLTVFRGPDFLLVGDSIFSSISLETLYRVEEGLEAM